MTHNHDCICSVCAGIVTNKKSKFQTKCNECKFDLDIFNDILPGVDFSRYYNPPAYNLDN